MKIRKYIDFINEEFNDTPEQYVDSLLQQIKKKIDSMFESESGEKEKKGEKSISDAKKDSKSNKDISFKDLGVRLESSEISKYSKQYDNLVVKFSDDSSTYNLMIMIDLKDAVPTDKEADFSSDNIEKCYVKFKKYNIDTMEVVGQLTKNVNPKDINEDFIIQLKIELDDKFGDDQEEEFSIETE
jgi:hypothetical protein